jgi:hypothetical protein
MKPYEDEQDHKTIAAIEAHREKAPEIPVEKPAARNAADIFKDLGKFGKSDSDDAKKALGDLATSNKPLHDKITFIQDNYLDILSRRDVLIRKMKAE